MFEPNPPLFGFFYTIAGKGCFVAELSETERLN